MELLLRGGLHLRGWRLRPPFKGKVSSRLNQVANAKSGELGAYSIEIFLLVLVWAIEADLKRYAAVTLEGAFGSSLMEDGRVVLVASFHQSECKRAAVLPVVLAT